MTQPIDRPRLESLRAELSAMLAEADDAGADMLAVHLSLAVNEVEAQLAAGEN